MQQMQAEKGADDSFQVSVMPVDVAGVEDSKFQGELSGELT